MTPGFENTLQTHLSQRLNPRCSQKSPLKGLRDGKGDTNGMTIFLIAVGLLVNRLG